MLPRNGRHTTVSCALGATSGPQHTGRSLSKRVADKAMTATAPLIAQRTGARLVSQPVRSSSRRPDSQAKEPSRKHACMCSCRPRHGHTWQRGTVGQGACESICLALGRVFPGCRSPCTGCLIHVPKFTFCSTPAATCLSTPAFRSSIGAVWRRSATRGWFVACRWLLQPSVGAGGTGSVAQAHRGVRLVPSCQGNGSGSAAKLCQCLVPPSYSTTWLGF